MSSSVAIVGAGLVAGFGPSREKVLANPTHAGACSQVEGLSLSTVCEEDAERLSRFKQLWNVTEGHSSLEGMLNAGRQDLVVIASPDDTHFTLAKTILTHSNSPRILLIEKPVCGSEDQLMELEKLSNSSDTRVLVNHNYRFHEGLRQVVGLIGSKAMGTVLYCRGTYYGGVASGSMQPVAISTSAKMGMAP